MLWICFPNIVVGSDFVNMLVALSLDQTCWISMSLFFSSYWVYENNFGGICLVRSLIIYPFLLWVIHAALYSNNIVGSLVISIPLAVWIWWLTYLSHTHSLLASCSAIISTWFEKVATSLYFLECHDIAVPSSCKISSLCLGFVRIR